MTTGNFAPGPWGTIHPSVYGDSARALRSARTTLRPGGALRYRCPVTGSWLLITDDATIARLARPRARLRCAACGELHLLVRDDVAAFVAEAATP